MARIGAQVAAVIGLAKEQVELFPTGQVSRAAELEPGECNMRPVEVDSSNLAGVGGQIAQDVATAGSNRDYVMMRLDGERFEIDDRVFPDLGINETAERECEHALEKSLARYGLGTMHGLAKQLPRLGLALDGDGAGIHPWSFLDSPKTAFIAALLSLDDGGMTSGTVDWS